VETDLELAIARELVIARVPVTDLGSAIVLVRETDPDLEIDPARATVLELVIDRAAVIVRDLVIGPVSETDQGAEIGLASAIDPILEIDPAAAIVLGSETDQESVIVPVSEIGREVVIDQTDLAVVIDQAAAIAPVGPALVIDLESVIDLTGETGLEIVREVATGRESAIDQAAIVLALAIVRVSTGRRTRVSIDRSGAIGHTATGTMAGGGVGTTRGIAGGIAVAGR
jgi:hypothetical protein